MIKPAKSMMSIGREMVAREVVKLYEQGYSFSQIAQEQPVTPGQAIRIIEDFCDKKRCNCCGIWLEESEKAHGRCDDCVTRYGVAPRELVLA